MMDRVSVHTGNTSEQFLHCNRNSCSHCTGGTFEMKLLGTACVGNTHPAISTFNNDHVKINKIF